MAEDAAKMIEVTINGSKKQIPCGLTVSGLLDFLNVKKQAAVVELNRVVLKKEEHDSGKVNEGDELEIVRFVGGG